MSGEFTRNFDAHYNFDKRGFEDDRDTTRPTFYIEQVVNPATGEMEDVEMVKVLSPGETLCIWGGRVTDEHRMRWAQHYQAFKRNETVTTGIPISKWPEVANNVDLVNELRRFGFTTVQEMAKMPDSALHLFHGALTYRKKAQLYLEQQGKIAMAEAAQAAANLKDEMLAKAEAANAALSDRLAKLEAAMGSGGVVKKNKGGRPRKNPLPESTAAA